MAIEFDGEQYARAAVLQRRWAGQMLEDLALRGAECVLDLGCGDGGITARVAEMVPRGHIVGIDGSAGMIATAQASYAATPNLEFRQHDIYQLDFAGEFDVVISNATLHWIHDLGPVLARIHRALRPGGRLRTSCGGAGNAPAVEATLRDLLALPRFAPHFREFVYPWTFLEADRARWLLQSAGFSRAEAWLAPGEGHFPDAEALVAWLDQPCLVPFLAVLGARDREAFRQLAIEQMLERTRQADGSYFERFIRLHLDAVK